MHPKAVVVVLHSLSKTIKCWKCSAEIPNQVFCESCQTILDFRSDITLSPFEILNLKESLLIDENELRSHFYELSKKLHPDRFASEPHPAPQYALRWTTALNRAYQTLKSREERTRYLIEKHLGSSPAATKAAIPTDLAEAYFEVQDLLSDGKKEPLLQFKQEIEKQLEESLTQWKQLAKTFDESTDKAQALEALRAHENREKYIRSMLNDIERKVTS